MRIYVNNLNRKEVRECHYAYIDNAIADSTIVVYITGFNIKLEFKLPNRDCALSILESLLTCGYYDFGNLNYKVGDLH